MIVADTNIIAYLALPMDYRAAAERLYILDPEWIAPQIWRSEFRNVMTLYMRKSMLTLEQALQVQAEAEDMMNGREFDVASADVLALAEKHAGSAYDCEFVALARHFDVALVTMDRKLIDAFPREAVLLTDFIEDRLS